MQRIETLLQKLNDLTRQPDQKTAIDVDLMLDYTRVLYADLLDWRTRLGPAIQASPKPAKQEPTLTEISTAMEQAHNEVVATAETTAPSIELSADAQHFEEKDDLPALHSVPANPQVHTYVPPPVQPVINAPRKDIRQFIDLNDQYLFLGSFFNNDVRAYEQALQEINNSANEHQAISRVNDHLFIREEHSATLQTLYEVIGRFFAARNQ